MKSLWSLRPLNNINFCSLKLPGLFRASLFSPFQFFFTFFRRKPHLRILSCWEGQLFFLGSRAYSAHISWFAFLTFQKCATSFQHSLILLLLPQGQTLCWDVEPIVFRQKQWISVHVKYLKEIDGWVTILCSVLREGNARGFLKSFSLLRTSTLRHALQESKYDLKIIIKTR